MKKYSLVFFALLACTPAFADGYDGNAPLIQGESWKWLNLNLVLFVAGIVLFIYIVRRLYDARLQRQYRSAQGSKNAKKDNIYEPRYWYQCRNCRVTIRKDSPPNSADCFKAVDHLWTQMAEVGTLKYLCKRCNTLIETRGVPVSENCPEGDLHNWEKLK